MVKPNANFSLPQIKAFMISKKNAKLLNEAKALGKSENKPVSKWTKTKWLNFLKMKKQYDDSKDAMKTKPAPKKKPAVKKAPAPKKKAAPKKATTTDALFNLGSDISKKIGVATQEAREVVKATKNYDDFLTLISDDQDFNDERYEREQNIMGDHTWGGEFYRILKKLKGRKKGKDSYEELTEDQKEQFLMLSVDMAGDEHNSYMKDLWKDNIKGKKFKSKKQLIDAFMKVYVG